MKWILSSTVGLVSLLAVFGADARLIEENSDETCNSQYPEEEAKRRFIESICKVTTDDIKQWISLAKSSDQLDREQLQNRVQKWFGFRSQSQTQSFVRLLVTADKLNLTPDQKRYRIVTLALRQLSLIGRIHRTPVVDQEAQDLRKSAGDALRRDPVAVELARSLLDKALELVCRSKDKERATSCRQISVELFRDMAWLAESELKFKEAALLYEAAATAQASISKNASPDLLKSAALWTDHAETTGQFAVLESVARLYERVLKITKYANDPMLRFRAQVNLGIALRNLAQDNAEMSRLQQSAKALRAGLDLIGESNVIFNPAIPIARANLGMTLYLIGELGNNKPSLKQSITEFEETLEDVERDRNPYLWAALKNNLGLSFLSLGRNTSDIQTLLSAKGAFSDAVSVWSGDYASERWAVAQSNLGVTLREIGSLSSSNKAIQEAITACRRALTVLSQEHQPLIWASTHNNLGAALNFIGLAENQDNPLQEATKSFHLALSVLKKDVHPTEWGRSQYGIGLAKYHLALSKQSDSEMETAIRSFRAASEVDKENSPWYERTHHILFKAHTFVGVKRTDHRELEYALAAIKETKDIKPHDIEMIKNIETLILLFKQQDSQD